MRLNKAPQERSTEKRINDRDTGIPIALGGDENSISVAEIGSSKRYPATFRTEEEIKLLRDWCNAWLEHNDSSE